MQEIESKRKLRASEGAHFFFTLIFLTATSIIKRRIEGEQCRNVDLDLLINLIFYGLLIWGTYLLISIVPRYKNPAIKIFFNFLDICFGIYLLALFIIANILYFDDNFAACRTSAPVKSFFTQLWLVVNYVIFVVLGLAVFTFIFRRFAKNPDEQNDDLEE